MKFAETMEAACHVTVNDQGKMTKDLAITVHGTNRYSVYFDYDKLCLASHGNSI